jgi:hypothetical protein
MKAMRSTYFDYQKMRNIVDEIDTGGESLRGQDSQPRQIGKRCTSHMHEALDKEAEDAHS